MITINPVKFNNTKPISFGEGHLNNLTPNSAILSLQDPSAQLNFKEHYKRTQKADAVQSNPITAIYWKFIKAIGEATGSSNEPKPNPMPYHISFMG